MGFGQSVGGVVAAFASVGVAGLVVGVGAGGAIGALGSEAGFQAARPAGDAAPEPAQLRSLAEIQAMIRDNNLFDAEAVRRVHAPPQQEQPSLDWQVLATMVAEPARFSSALVRIGGKQGRSEALGVGDEVGGVTVVSVGPAAVLVALASGQTVSVPLLTAPPERAKPARSARKSRRRGPNIKRIGPDHVEVSKRLVKRFVDQPARLASLGRARPQRRNGEVVGYRLSRIRKNSHAHRVGLRNGDVVKAVNGHSLTSTSSAMSAYAALSAEDKFEIDIDRRRRGKTLRVDVR